MPPASPPAQAPAEARGTVVEELVDLYDEAGRVVGRAPRSRVRAENLPHAGTGVVVRNSRGEIYVHRRTDTKDVFPGCYDLAAGGVVAAGEDPDDAAVREAAEELGVRGVPLRPLGVTRYADERTTYVAFLYETVYDGPITHQSQEVAWGAWMTPEQVLARLDDPAWPFVPDSRALLADRVRAWACDPVAG